jgi:hypothetical protein
VTEKRQKEKLIYSADNLVKVEKVFTAEFLVDGEVDEKPNALYARSFWCGTSLRSADGEAEGHMR